MEKASLDKFTQIPLLKNDAQLKKKKWQTTKKHYSHPNLLKNKNHVLEKIMYKKKKKKHYHTLA